MQLFRSLRMRRREWPRPHLGLSMMRRPKRLRASCTRCTRQRARLEEPRLPPPSKCCRPSISLFRSPGRIRTRGSQVSSKNSATASKAASIAVRSNLGGKYIDAAATRADEIARCQREALSGSRRRLLLRRSLSTESRLLCWPTCLSLERPRRAPRRTTQPTAAPPRAPSSTRARPRSRPCRRRGPRSGCRKRRATRAWASARGSASGTGIIHAATSLPPAAAPHLRHWAELAADAVGYACDSRSPGRPGGGRRHPQLLRANRGRPVPRRRTLPGLRAPAPPG